MVRWCDGATVPGLAGSWSFTKIPLEGRNGTAGALGEDDRFVAFERVDVTSIHRVLQVILGLHEGRSRNIQIAGEVRMGPSTEAFGDVAWGGGRGVANLITEPKIPVDGRNLRQTVNSQLEFVRQLPAVKVLEMTRSAHALPAARHGPSRFTA